MTIVRSASPRPADDRRAEHHPRVAAPRVASVRSVGHLAGLRPRGRSGSEGDVPGADVDLVDSLDPPAWRTVVAWLRDTPSLAGRRSRLQTLAAFLRWLPTLDPAPDLLAATGAHLDAYCEAARAGSLTVGVRTPGKPLAKATVARRRTALSSFYTYAWERGVLGQAHSTGPRTGPARDTARRGVDTARRDVDTGRRGDAARDAGPAAGPAPDAAPVPAITREERRLLREGAGLLATEGRPAEAAAVALLEATGATAATLARLTAQDIHAGGEGGDDRPGVIVLRDEHGGVVAFPLGARARSLLRRLCADRPAGQPLIRRDDGDPVDGAWLGRALAEAARAGGIPAPRAEALHPRLLRATTATDLLRAGAVSQAAAGRAGPS